MASGTLGSSATPSGGQLVEHQKFIDQQLLKTRQQVKTVDLTTRVLLLVTGVAVYLLVAALVDHWLARGGLGTTGRTLFCLVLVAGSLAYLAWGILPVLLRGINPVFAAHTIERGTPGLKNSLINFLLLRRGEQAVPAGVVAAVEQQAANKLSGVALDHVVDWRQVIRILMVCAAVIVFACGYMLLSPKNLLSSVARIVVPWADVAPPTRVTIRDIQPGDTQRFHDDFASISAHVSGLRPGEAPELVYSTADGQVVDQVVPMKLKDGEYRHSVDIPDGAIGLQTNVTYRIRAGDDISALYTIDVLLTPSITVDEIELRYPAYTELPPLVLKQQTNIQALEGTSVVVRATANQEIRSRSAYLDFDRDRRNSPLLNSSGRSASGEFVLRMKPGTQEPEHTSFQLRFKNQDGIENPRPIEHRIDVVADLPPQITFVEATAAPPKEDRIELGRILPLGIEAMDPDFKLARVTLFVERDGERLLEQSLLAQPRGGRARLNYLVDTSQLKLEGGDLISYWAEAEDNRQPQPNRAQTARYRLWIDSPPAVPADNNNQLAQNDPQRREQGEPQAGDRRPEPNQGPQGEPMPPQDGEPSPEQPADQNAPGESGKQPAESKAPSADSRQRVDPDADPGQAFEELARHFEQERQQQQRPADAPQNDSQQPPPPDKNSQDNPPPEQSPPTGDQQSQSQQNSPPQDNPAGSQPQSNNSGDSQSQQPSPAGQSGEQQPQPSPADPSQQNQPGGGDPQKSDQQSGQQSGGNSEGTKSPDGQPQGQPSSADENSPPSGDPSAPQSPGKLPSDAQPQQSGAGAQQQRDGNSADSQAQPSQPSGEAGGSKSDSAGQPMGDEPTDANEPAPGGQATGGKPTGEPSDSNQQQQGDAAGSESKPADGQPAGEKPQPGEGTPGEKPIAPDQATGGQPGQGDKTGSTTEPSNPGQSGASQDQPQDTSDARGGDEQTSKGTGGPEGKPGDDAATPAPQENTRPRDKSQQSTNPSQDGDTTNEASSPSTSKEESSSDGETSGDRSGDGEQGGGMKSPREGTGSAGENTSSDEGAGAAQESGKGETANRPGDKAPGQSGDSSAQQTPGQGDQTRPGGEKPGQGQSGQPASPQGTAEGQPSPQPSPSQSGQSSDQAGSPQANEGVPSSEPADGSPQDNATSNSGGGSTPGNPTGVPQGGDRSAPPTAPSGAGGEPGGEEANREYARETMDLVLERLKDQLESGQLDQKMLDKLQWTREDVERFVRRWEELRAAAKQPGAAGQQAAEQFDRALEDLGLRPAGTSIAGGKSTTDGGRNLRETRRSAPPPEYLDQTRAYTRGTSGYNDPE